MLKTKESIYVFRINLFRSELIQSNRTFLKPNVCCRNFVYLKKLTQCFLKKYAEADIPHDQVSFLYITVNFLF